MNHAHLGYDSQKIVLQYLEPNVRFLLSRRCPAICTAEKLVPIKIDHLLFGTMKTQVNNTTYHLGIYRDYEPGAYFPVIHATENESGGDTYEIDEWGFRDNTHANLITPGDLNLRCADPDSTPRSDERRLAAMIELERSLKKWEHNFEEHQEGGPRDKLNHEFASKYYKERIDKLKMLLQPYHSQRNGTSRPYTCYIQLTTTTSSGQVTVERVHYDRKLWEAWKYLNAVFIGGRAEKVMVNELEFENTREYTIFRLPEDVKLAVKEIKTNMIEFSRLDSLIDPLNYTTIPKTITDRYDPIETYEQPAIRQAKCLTLYMNFYDGGDIYYEYVRQIQNEVVVLPREIEQQYHVRIVKHWLRHGRPIGTIFSFGVKEEETVKECLKVLAAKFRGYVINDRKRYITFTMPAMNSMLRVYYERILIPPTYGQANWYLVLKVERA